MGDLDESTRDGQVYRVAVREKAGRCEQSCFGPRERKPQKGRIKGVFKVKPAGVENGTLKSSLTNIHATMTSIFRYVER